MRNIFATLALASILGVTGPAQAVSMPTIYTINSVGGISGYNTATGAQVFSTQGFGLDPTYGNLSFGPDGNLYAEGGGSAATLAKINVSNGQVSYIGSSYSGAFAFGNNNTLYMINQNGGISGYNTVTGTQVFSAVGAYNNGSFGISPRYGNLSFGPDGYLYANGGGQGSQLWKISTANGHGSSFGNSSNSAAFAFGSNNTLYTINQNGGTSGYNTVTGAQLFSTQSLGIDPTQPNNISSGPDGYLYADGVGLGFPRLAKINVTNLQISNIGMPWGGAFAFGSANTLYMLDPSGISGYNTVTGVQVFSAGGGILGINTPHGNLSFGPDGYLYASGGGQGSNLWKIDITSGQVSPFVNSASSGKFVFSLVSSVPEADTYTYFSVGLGLLAWIARRRGTPGRNQNL